MGKTYMITPRTREGEIWLNTQLPKRCYRSTFLAYGSCFLTSKKYKDIEFLMGFHNLPKDKNFKIVGF